MSASVDAAIAAVWRIESAKIVAGVARLVRDIGLAEELAGDALVAALEHWPDAGIPDNPGAWLMRTAQNAALDHLRRDKSYREKCAQIGHDLEALEAQGLVALMELQASRAAARVDREGRPVLLLEQDRLRWDGILIRRGLAALARAELLGPPGPYTLQAAIAACHARAHTAAATDWQRIAALYGELARVSASPVVELNRAVAVGMAEGPAAGLALVDALAEGGALPRYQWLPAVRGDLLEKLGRHGDAGAEFLRAAQMATNARERELLEERARANAGRDDTEPGYP